MLMRDFFFAGKEVRFDDANLQKKSNISNSHLKSAAKKKTHTKKSFK